MKLFPCIILVAAVASVLASDRIGFPGKNPMFYELSELARGQVKEARETFIRGLEESRRLVMKLGELRTYCPASEGSDLQDIIDESGIIRDFTSFLVMTVKSNIKSTSERVNSTLCRGN
ncbi:hypothetical protein AAG570_004338 [Ranatra chinensis]|uniref:Uncharacterized protein n=1 Tax=Ranatra chinensis TaxID=642074 RepID=A0ABD0Y2Y4_9HEMI